MANDSFSQQALAGDASFRRRLKGAIANVAWQVLTEDPGVPSHAARASYARTVISNLDGATGSIAGWIVMRTNLFAPATSVSLHDGVPTVTTAATDADIESQLATDWTALAGG